ncbi:hypothetical protein HanRHA438_Chr11g0509341 [Helianthus annuus]|nr:hypothetical protein HanIR_Chr11g0534861 [Helianthus annuus]KAJ0871190.1 hypothetical protein HanRHA438_Chr11g0509341 [Helianthus annuus]
MFIEDGNVIVEWLAGWSTLTLLIIRILLLFTLLLSAAVDVSNPLKRPATSSGNGRRINLWWYSPAPVWSCSISEAVLFLTISNSKCRIWIATKPQGGSLKVSGGSNHVN